MQVVKTNIVYSKSSYKKIAPKKEIIFLINWVCKKEFDEKVSINIAFVTDDEIKKINNIYTKNNRSTDILSFAECDVKTDAELFFRENGYRNLGDILICPEVMCQNACEFNVSESEELYRLIIHGVLHLKGMNHKGNSASEPMIMRQEEILRSFQNLSKEDCCEKLI